MGLAVLSKVFTAIGKVGAKTWKAMGKAYKGMADINTSQIMQFVKQLKFIEYIMKPVNALFKAFLSGFSIPIIEASKPLVQILTDLIPLFREAGLIAGQWLVDNIGFLVVWLIELFTVFMEDIVPILPDLITNFFNFSDIVLSKILPGLIPLIPQLFDLSISFLDLLGATSPLLKPLTDFTIQLVRLLEEITPLIPLIETFVSILEASLSAFDDYTNILDSTITLIEEVYQLIQDLEDLLDDLDIDLGDYKLDIPGTDIEIPIPIPGAQHGAYTNNYEGLIYAHPHEYIIPEDKITSGGITIIMDLSDSVIADDYSLNKLLSKIKRTIWTELG